MAAIADGVGDEVSAENQGPAGTHSILNWYDSTRPMFIDLVGDYAGKELFLVEGDSLLRECFEDERVDFDGMMFCFNPFSLVYLCIAAAVLQP